MHILYAMHIPLFSIPSAITFLPSKGGRLGDHLITYCKAKYIASFTQLDFYCPDFPYKDELMLDTYEQSLMPHVKKQFKKEQFLSYVADNMILERNDVLYTIALYTSVNNWTRHDSTRIDMQAQHFQDMLQECTACDNFMREIRHTIQPKEPLHVIQPPKDCISIAVHVRKGGNFDSPLLSQQYYSTVNLDYPVMIDPSIKVTHFSDWTTPLKFPPEQYYINQIKKILRRHKNQNIYIHIFTDDIEPHVLAFIFQHTLQKKNIHINYCTTSSVLTDLFSMTHFDYLIRPYSFFSLIAELLGTHKLIISPCSWEWRGDILHIYRSFVTIKKNVGYEYATL